MLISRSPLRVTLGGCGTDLPSYYKRNNGFVISAAIDKYVYVTITRPFKEGIYLKYSEIEKVKKASQIFHPIIREVLKEQKLKTPQIEITTLTDIPSGTGLGSSGSFTTALIKALYSYNNKQIQPEVLAEKACDIELNKLNEPIGKQDQYISAFGGINCFYFKKDGKVIVEPLKIGGFIYPLYFFGSLPILVSLVFIFILFFIIFFFKITIMKLFVGPVN